MKRTLIIIMTLVFAACAPQTRPISPQPPTSVPTETTQIGAPTPAESSDGGQTGNGGFLISQGARQILDMAQELIIQELTKYDQNFLNESTLSEKPVAKEKLLLLISNMKKDKYEGKNAQGTNEKGETEPKSFSIENIDGQETIVAQPLFFNSYAAIEPSPSVIQDVMTAILHESLHVFGYDEKMARSYSQDLMVNMGQSKNCLQLKKGYPDFNCFTGTDKDRKTRISSSILDLVKFGDQSPVKAIKLFSITGSSFDSNSKANLAFELLMKKLNIQVRRGESVYNLSQVQCAKSTAGILCSGFAEPNKSNTLVTLSLINNMYDVKIYDTNYSNDVYVERFFGNFIALWK